MEKRRIETVDDLMEVVGKQNEAILGLGNLVRAMDPTVKSLEQKVEAQDEKIRLLTALVDYDHKVLSKLAGLPPRPKEEEPIVN